MGVGIDWRMVIHFHAARVVMFFFCLHDEAWVWTNIYSIRQLALAEEVAPGPQALSNFASVVPQAT
jgi:hypothetical protein